MESNMNIMSRLREDLQENTDTYVTLIAGIIATLVSLLSGSVAVTLAAVAGTLTILAFGSLRDRHNARKLRVLLSDIERALPFKSIIRRRVDYGDIRDIIHGARSELQILVRTGDRLKQLDDLLREALGRGCHIKIIVCSPDDSTVKVLAYRDE